MVEWALEDITSVMRSWAERGRVRVEIRSRDFIGSVLAINKGGNRQWKAKEGVRFEFELFECLGEVSAWLLLLHL